MAKSGLGRADTPQRQSRDRLFVRLSNWPSVEKLCVVVPLPRQEVGRCSDRLRRDASFCRWFRRLPVAPIALFCP